MFAAVWATCTVSLIKISPVDAAECCPIIEDFDRHLMPMDTDTFSYSTQMVHDQEFLIAAPVMTGVGLIATYKEEVW